MAEAAGGQPAPGGRLAGKALQCTCNHGRWCFLSWHLHTTPSVTLGRVVQMPHQPVHYIYVMLVLDLSHFKG